MHALQQPLLLRFERLALEPRLLPHLDLVPRHDERQHRHALRLREPAPDAASRPSAEGEERVAVVAPQEARRLELVRFLPVPRVVVQRGGADRDVGAARDRDGALLAGGVRGREGDVVDVDLGDEDDGGEEAEGLVQDARAGLV